MNIQIPWGGGGGGGACCCMVPLNGGGGGGGADFGFSEAGGGGGGADFGFNEAGGGGGGDGDGVSSRAGGGGGRSPNESSLLSAGLPDNVSNIKVRHYKLMNKSRASLQKWSCRWKTWRNSPGNQNIPLLNTLPLDDQKQWSSHYLKDQCFAASHSLSCVALRPSIS